MESVFAEIKAQIGARWTYSYGSIIAIAYDLSKNRWTRIIRSEEQIPLCSPVRPPFFQLIIIMEFPRINCVIFVRALFGTTEMLLICCYNIFRSVFFTDFFVDFLLLKIPAIF